MRIEAVQRFTTATPAHVIAAYRDRSMFESLSDLPFVGRPVVVEHRTDDAGVVLVGLRYLVQIDLPAAARAFIDPAKMTFVERSQHQASGISRFSIQPDHYRELLTASGSNVVRSVDGADGCERVTTGDVKVDLGWQGMMFESQVEQAIGKGLQQALRAQTAQVEAFMVERYGLQP